MGLGEGKRGPRGLEMPQIQCYIHSPGSWAGLAVGMSHVLGHSRPGLESFDTTEGRRLTPPGPVQIPGPQNCEV